MKLHRYIKLKFYLFLFNILKNFFSLLGLNFYQVPYSNYSSIIYLIYKKNSKKKYKGIRRNRYFNFDVFSQESDLRAVFKNCWDEEATRIAVLVLLTKLLNRFDFYDIGANYGLYSLPFLKIDNVCRHLIVEPNPFLVTCLEKTFLGSKAKIISNALTNDIKEKKLLFNLKPFASGASTLEDFIINPAPLSTLKMNVNTISHSKMFDKYKVANKCIIKIDIEGSESYLLKDGFLETLSKIYQDFIIIIEFIPRLLNKNQVNIFINKLSKYYCVPLTNLNYRNETKYKYAKNFFLNKNSISRFYQTNYGKGILWFINDKKFLYSDIIIFSSEILAKNSLDIKY